MHPSVRTQMSCGNAAGLLGWMGANAGSVVPLMECHCWSSMPAHNAVSGPLWQDAAPGHRGALFRMGSSSTNKPPLIAQRPQPQRTCRHPRQAYSRASTCRTYSIKELL